MLKLIGAALIIAVCGFFGIAAALKLKNRHARLRDFYMLLGEISDKIRIGYSLEEMFSSKQATALCEKKGYVFIPKCEGLSLEDEALLTQFFSELGMSDAEAGISRCESYREILKSRVEIAEAEVFEKARLYSLLGLFSGVFISILLI